MRIAGVVDATVVYELGERVWRQSFRARMLDEHDLRAELSASGLSFEAWLDRERGWFTARPAADNVS
jgi:hypothetical protein